MALSLISLNIEREKHFERFLPFLTDAAPDVVCFQELLERSIPRITEALGGTVAFTATERYGNFEGEPVQGVGIWSRTPLTDVTTQQYGRHRGDDLRTFREGMTPEEMYDIIRYSAFVGDLEKDGETYRIATTHFVWTPQGESNDMQKLCAESLLATMNDKGDYVLCGDMNAPRGRATFARFASVLTDNIPQEYETSLDKDLHRAGPLPYMVDGLFTTPGYKASGVRLRFGVSDHAAIVATIEKAA